MIKTREQAARIQQRRLRSGKRGRAKAVRRWFSREYGRAVEAHGGIPDSLRLELAANFEGCRSFEETYELKT